MLRIEKSGGTFLKKGFPRTPSKDFGLWSQFGSLLLCAYLLAAAVLSFLISRRFFRFALQSYRSASS